MGTATRVLSASRGRPTARPEREAPRHYPSVVASTERPLRAGSRTFGSARLRVRVAPGARRSEVVGRLGDAWKVRVRSAPERGRANDELVELLAGTLGLTRSELRVVAGHTARDKIVEFDRLPLEEAERLLASGKDEP